MSDLQAGSPSLGGRWGLKQLIDIDDEEAKEDLRRLSAAALSLVAQSARGDQPPVPEAGVMEGKTAAERFLLTWRGEIDEKHARGDRHLLDLHGRARAERIDVHRADHCLHRRRLRSRALGAVGALSGPLHGGAPARVLPMLDAVAEIRRRGEVGERCARPP